MNFKDTIRFKAPVVYRLIKNIKSPYNRLVGGQKKKKRNEMFRLNSESVFSEFCDAFDEAGERFWLAFGTLLGAVREHNFIAHDLDIDVGVFAETNFLRLDECLAKRGFIKIRQIDIYSQHHETEGYEMTYGKNNVTIDIFLFYKSNIKENHLYTHAFFGGDRSGNYVIFPNVLRIEFPFDKLRDYRFLNHKVLIPNDYEAFLKAHYGPEFMTPNPCWKLTDSYSGFIVSHSIGLCKNK